MEKIGHDADITLWINYGSGPDDKTTLEQRKEAGNKKQPIVVFKL